MLQEWHGIFEVLERIIFMWGSLGFVGVVGMVNALKSYKCDSFRRPVGWKGLGLKFLLLGVLPIAEGRHARK
jgi:hypothetical protein